ncbi:MAG: NUDIX hydrolase [Mollicutes bacterium]|nr:NUDIX hydrolase [Mollicutes bacterium]
MENVQNFKLIAHVLVKIKGKYLLIKRTPIKRGRPNAFPEYWDIPGGMVEVGEKPSEAAIRETKEEVNLDIIVGPVLHEDSNYDVEKKAVFTRLVYQGELLPNQSEKDIILLEDEHSEYKLVDNIKEVDKSVDYLCDTIKNANKYNQ